MKNALLTLTLGLALTHSAMAVVNGAKVDKKSVGLGGAQDYIVGLTIEKVDGAGGIGGGKTVSYCTGVLISPTAILTAGHCATSKPKATFNGKPLEVSSVQLRSGFNKKDVYAAKSLNNDLALIKLKNPPKAGFKVARIPDRNENLKTNLNLTVIGYGRTGLDGKALAKEDMGTLRKGLNSSYSAANNDILINQSLGGAGLCEGDSGSPLLEENTQGFTVWGIASTVRPPALVGVKESDKDLPRKNVRAFLSKYPKINLCKGTGIYTDLRSELEWIRSALAQ